MGMGSEDQATARGPVTQIFRYLEELNRRRNPLKRRIEEQSWRFRFADLPANPAVTVGWPSAMLAEAEVLTAGGQEMAADGALGRDYVLRVGRSILSDVPPPPEVLANWLQLGWVDPGKPVQVVPSRKGIDQEGEPVSVLFGDAPERVEALASWQVLREEWAEKERPARAARRLFEELYEVYGRMEREAERQELVLGDGLLSWSRAGGAIRHPILIQRLSLNFDPQKAEFVLRQTEHPVELYSALFRAIPEVDGSVIGKCRQELEDLQLSLMDNEVTSGFLRRLVVQLSARGEFLGETPMGPDSESPRVARDPVLFLRSRTLGFAAALESILMDIRQRRDLPTSLLNVAGIESLPAHRPGPNGAATAPSINEQILLSKPANQEQIEIARRLDAYGCVLVQGPPGTGKTHTIANLIGHLLAQGKSILVTSHTAKALRVLREQVVPQLQPLCVSVLEGGGESRQQLEQSVAAIVERLASTDADALSRQGEAVAQRRRLLREDLEQQKRELQNARFDEYRDVVVAGKAYSPSEAARQIAASGADGWIPPPVSAGSPLPLTAGELIALYRTNVTLDAQDERDISGTLPKIDDLLPPTDFARLLADREALEKEDLSVLAELWRAAPVEVMPERIEALSLQVARAVTLMNHGTDWQSAAIEAGRQGGPVKQAWSNLLTQIETVGQEAAAAQESLMRYGPVLAPGEDLEAQMKILAEVVQYLEGGRSLSWAVLLTHPTWKKMLPMWRVGVKPPKSQEDFSALLMLAEVELRREQLKDWWERQMTPLGGATRAELGLQPEVACRQYQPLIQEALNWYQATWTPLEREFQRIGFNWPGLLQKMPLNLTARGDLLRLRDAVLQSLPSVFRSRANFLRASRVQKQISTVGETLASLGGSDVAPLITQFKEALAQWDTSAYEAAYARLTELNQKSADLSARQGLLHRLEAVAPAWAASIRDRRPLHDGQDLPGDAEAAWLWRQLSDELDRRQRTSLNMLQQKIAQTEGQLQEATAELVDAKAWEAQVRRTSLDQRKSLIGWLQTVRRIGKGTGKRVPELQAQARRLMGEARTAVPVWIMPLTRVVESFDPATVRFDVVIIDEASQSDAMSLIALYMGAQVVVVGDDEQVSPDAVGENIEDTQNLIAEHLTGIPNAHLFDGKQSIYDLAMSSFGGTICLREHFRCVSDIIQFSNRLSYDGKIKPLRDASSVVTKPYVVSHRVEGAASANKVNEEEALAMVSLLIAATEQPEYADSTIGVISLVGEEQALRIDTLLHQHLSPVEYEQRRIMCGTPAQFQGDERDVMFLSMVDGPQGGPLPLRQQPLFRKRFNVAASRARDQMWVVHSLSLEDLKVGDLRRSLIEHAQNPQAFEQLLQEQEKKTESEFERQVLKRLMVAKYRVQPQWKVGSYRIDMVVEGGGKRLAVECDGDRYHTLDNLAEDMQRQAVLERLGWSFVRIRGSEFFRDADRAMRPLFMRLEEMDIPPSITGTDAGTLESDVEELKVRVIRRADCLRREWKEEANPSSSAHEQDVNFSS